MNIEAFVGPLNAALTGLDPSLTGLDRWADAAVYLLVQGKFYTLFSLLFGVGFAVLMVRAERTGRSFGRLYGRRLFGLAVIGAIHALLIWSGDVLLIYALVGALLLLFRRTPTERLPRWGLAIYLLPALFTFLFVGLIELARLVPEGAAEMERQMAEGADLWRQTIEAQRLAYGPDGSFAAATGQRLDDLAQNLGYVPFWGPMVLGMFLIGAWFWRSGVLADSRRHRAVFERMRFWGFVLGLPLVALGFWLVPSMEMHRLDFLVTVAGLAAMLGNLALCLAYLSTVVLALQRPRWGRALTWLAPMGRMALSNYLMQSLICVGIFYGYGLGYFERLPRAWQIPFAVAVFVLQALYSRWWLERFRFGPVEWFWRWMTYGHRPPMRV